MRWSPWRPATSQLVKSLRQVGKAKQQNNVGKESKANTYQLSIPRKLCNFNPQVHKRSDVAWVLVPLMHLPKAPPHLHQNQNRKNE